MRPQHLVFALVMAAAAGTNWVASKIAVDTLPPLLTVAMRFAILSVALSPFARVFKGQMVNVFAVAVTLGVMQFGFMFQSLSLSEDVSTMAVANQLYVPFSTILGIIFLGERVGWVRSVAIAIAFGGVVVMGFDPAALRQFDAMVFVILSAMSLSISSLFMRKLSGIKVFQLQFWLAFLAFPQMLLLSLIFMPVGTSFCGDTRSARSRHSCCSFRSWGLGLGSLSTETYCHPRSCSAAR
jgi:O-acetylserine/cysteine efflux transporter